MEILKSYKVEQEVRKGLITGKSHKTIADQAVGKHYVQIQFDNGYVIGGFGKNESDAIDDVKAQYQKMIIE